MKLPRWPSALIALPALALSQPAIAQVGSITGTVKSLGTGAAIEGARVELVGTSHLTNTSARGEFALRSLTPGKYVIQASAIGFSRLTAELEVKAGETLEVRFEAQSEAVQLPELTVAEAPRLPDEFVRRSMEGGGRYMSRAEIERRPGARNVAELLRTFPGVRVNCRRWPCTVEFTRTTRRCPPAFFLDGMATEAAAVLMQPARELDGIEMYSGLAETPPELRERNTCGALAVWTRTPPDARKKPGAPAAPRG